MKKIRNIMLLFSLMLLLSCDEIDESPAEVNMQLTLKGEVDNSLKFSNLSLNLEEIKIDADNENGEKFTFTETLNRESFELDNNVTESLFQFNLPPGIYTNITIAINLKENREGKSMVFNGMLSNRNPTQTENIPIIFEQQGREFIELALKSSSSSSEIIVQRGEKLDAKIKIEVSHIFQSINPGLLIAAENIPVQGMNAILINRQNNPEIYNAISSRVNQAFKATF